MFSYRLKAPWSQEKRPHLFPIEQRNSLFYHDITTLRISGKGPIQRSHLRKHCILDDLLNVTRFKISESTSDETNSANVILTVRFGE